MATFARTAAVILLLAGSAAVVGCGKGDGPRAGAGKRTSGSSAGSTAAREAAAPAPSATAPHRVAPPAGAGPAPADRPTPVLVNGDPITTADLDAMVMATHATMDMRRLAAEGARRLLDKAINDLLLVQQAEVMGMDEEPEIEARLERTLAAHAMRAYVAQAFAPPDSVPPARLRAHFDRYYGKVHLRQVSLRTEAEARAALAAVRAGADMDSLARAASLDARQINGGLHNLKHWADVEEVLRRQVRGLPAKAYSDVFPLRDSFSFLRVEQLLPPDRDERPRFEKTIRERELADVRQEAWLAFLDRLAAKTPVTRDDAVLRAVAADSADVVHADFRRGSARPALVLKTGGGQKLTVDERELRDIISRVAMASGGLSFAVQMERGVAQARQDLLLRAAATAAGWYEHPDVLALYERDRRQLLLEGYLEQVVMPRIVFRREEIRKYWDAHQDEFREPDEVKLATLLIHEADKAREAAERLAGGADFEFVRRRYDGGEQPPELKWVQADGFSDQIKAAIAGLQPGRTTPALETPSGWLLLKLEGRRPGRVRPLEESEVQIRAALLEDRFREVMDEHLGTLKKRSRIVTHQERIESYFGDRG